MKLASVKAKLDAYERLIRLDKPVGFLLLMWPTLWGLWMAAYGAPDIRVVASPSLKVPGLDGERHLILMERA